MPHKIFTIKEGRLVIHDELVLANKYIRKVVEQQNSSAKFKGGGSRATEELAYIFYIADITSPLYRHGYDERDAMIKAKELIGLPFTWKPSKEIEDAIVAYKEHQSNISTDTILELLRTFRLHKEVISKVRASLSASLKVDKLSKSAASDITNLIGYILELSKDIPSTVRDLKKAIRELESEDDSNKEEVRGTNEVVPESADPDMA